MKTRRMILMLLLIGSATIQAEGGDATLTLGYKFDDLAGSQSVNQETFNTYEGIGLSLTNGRYLFSNGFVARADLANITRNDRHISASVSKPGRVRFSLSNNQYRRVYGPAGEFARRRSTAIKLSITPLSRYQLFGGFKRTDRKGQVGFQIAGFETAQFRSTDYSQSTYNLGSRLTWSQGLLRVEYRRYEFDDKVASSHAARTADSYRINLSARPPGHDWLQLSSGFYHRIDKIESSNLELKTNQFWVGTKMQLPSEYMLDYRFQFARTSHSGSGRETDNAINTISVGKNFGRVAGTRIAYENRIADDLISRTVSNGILVNGWYNHAKRIFIKGSVATRTREVKTGATLLGDEDRTKHRFSVRYIKEELGDLTLAWVGRVRENPDIDSRADYNSYSTALNLRIRDYVNLSLSHSYYVGKYENRSDDISYEFSDHVLGITATPASYHGVEAMVGGTYYRSRRDADIEKFGLSFAATYKINSDYRFHAEYEVFNYDDFLTAGDYYTANIVELKISRDISIK